MTGRIRCDKEWWISHLEAETCNYPQARLAPTAKVCFTMQTRSSTSVNRCTGSIGVREVVAGERGGCSGNSCPSGDIRPEWFGLTNTSTKVRSDVVARWLHQ